jgi:3-methyladenine DNA glycosylase/8-oxoguanine DNA glycosylase
MNRNLVEQFGDPLPDDPSRRAFPSPKALARVNVETLRSETKLGYRAPYIRELAQAVSDGSLDLTAFTDGSLTTDQLRKRLLAIKGVGAYAAANLMMLLGHYDDLPVDSWALKMVSQEWHGGEPVGPAEVYAAFERWGLWRGLAYWFWEWDRHSEGA